MPLGPVVTVDDNLTSAISLAPKYSHHRSVADAAADGAIIQRAVGINGSRHKKALIQVVPTGGANPNVEVLWWSEKAGKFISENPALAKTGLGVDTPYEFAVDLLGRIMFVSITGGTLGAGKTVDIYVAGADAELMAT